MCLHLMHYSMIEQTKYEGTLIYLHSACFKNPGWIYIVYIVYLKTYIRSQLLIVVLRKEHFIARYEASHIHSWHISLVSNTQVKKNLD